MQVYRLSSPQYSHDLSGRGAARHGQRWNSKGISLLYASESRALAAWEVAVHVDIEFMENLFRFMVIEIPDDIFIPSIHSDDLTNGWNTIPAPVSLKQIGDSFVEGNKYLVMRVPSVVIRDESNLLINPAHKEFSRVKLLQVTGFKFDSRIAGKK